jgi:hypothetical protein
LKRSTLRFLSSDVLFVAALAAMFFSTILPFAAFVPTVFHDQMGMPLIVPPPTYYSSFSVRYMEGSGFSSHYFSPRYFGDYWFQEDFARGIYIHSVVSNLLIVTFVMQVVTLAAGFAVFWMRRVVRLLPLLMWTTVVVLLTSDLYSFFGGRHFWSFADIGYWLSYLATGFVLGSVVLGRARATLL